MIKRIVSLAPSISETICALGRQELLIGVTEYCNYPDYCLGLPKIGGFANPDVNKIFELEPDCIITSTFHKPEKLAIFKDKGIRIEQIKADNIKDSSNVIVAVGKLIGEEEKAIKLSQQIALQINETFNKVTTLQNKPKVCYLCTSVPFCSYKPKCQTNHLVSQLGGQLITYTKENIINDIIENDPDLIIIPYKEGSNDYKTQMAFIADNPELKATRAYKNNKIVSINGELLSRPGPRSAEGLNLLFKLIHY